MRFIILLMSFAFLVGTSADDSAAPVSDTGTADKKPAAPSAEQSTQPQLQVPQPSDVAPVSAKAPPQTAQSPPPQQPVHQPSDVSPLSTPANGPNGVPGINKPDVADAGAAHGNAGERDARGFGFGGYGGYGYGYGYGYRPWGYRPWGRPWGGYGYGGYRPWGHRYWG